MPQFAWPTMPAMPQFAWPAMPQFAWPAMPQLSWPAMPEMPQFSWPALPEFRWPELPQIAQPEPVPPPATQGKQLAPVTITVNVNGSAMPQVREQARLGVLEAARAVGIS